MCGDRTKNERRVVEAMGDNVQRLMGLWSGWHDFVSYLGWQTMGVDFALSELRHAGRSARVLVFWGQYCIPANQRPVEESEQMQVLLRLYRELKTWCTVDLYYSGGVTDRERGYLELSAKRVHACMEQAHRLSHYTHVAVDLTSRNTGDQARTLADSLYQSAKDGARYSYVVLVLPRCHMARFAAALAHAIDHHPYAEVIDRPRLIPAAWGTWASVTRFGLTQAQEAFDPMTPTSAEGADVLGGVASVRTPVDQLVEGVVPEGMCGQYGRTRYFREVTAEPEGPFAWKAYGPAHMLRAWRR